MSPMIRMAAVVLLAVASHAAHAADPNEPAADRTNIRSERAPTTAEPEPYAYTESTRARNQAYYKAAKTYCQAYTGKVRDACLGEAAMMYAQ